MLYVLLVRYRQWLLFQSLNLAAVTLCRSVTASSTTWKLNVSVLSSVLDIFIYTSVATATGQQVTESFSHKVKERLHCSAFDTDCYRPSVLTATEQVTQFFTHKVTTTLLQFRQNNKYFIALHTFPVIITLLYPMKNLQIYCTE